MRAGLYTPRYLLPLVHPKLAELYAERQKSPTTVAPFNGRHWQIANLSLSLQRDAARNFAKAAWVRSGPDRLHWAVADTGKFLLDPSVSLIKGASFFVNVSPAEEKPFGFFAKAFLLNRLEGRGFEMIEVSDAEVPTPVEMMRVALQYAILRRSGTEPAAVSLLTASAADLAAKRENFNHAVTFEKIDRTAEVRALVPEAEKRLDAAVAMLLHDAPRTHADDPAIPEALAVSSLPHSKFKWWTVERLLTLGITDVGGVPEGFRGLDEAQKRMIAAHKKGEEYIQINKVGLKGVFAARGGRPTHYLDFETEVRTLPDGTRVDIPVQFSNHVVGADGEVLEHTEFLCDKAGDPREQFAECLIEALSHFGGDGKVIVYYQDFEESRIRETAAYLRGNGRADLADKLEAVIPRFQDQLKYLKDFVTHSGFKGSYSLKSTFPVLVKNPRTRYEDLSIHHGGEAAEAILKLRDPATPAEEKAALAKALFEYCALDTYAMIEIDRSLVSAL